MTIRRSLMLAAMAGLAILDTAAAQNIGPSTTTEPYVVPTRTGVSTTSILTTGDSIGGYRMPGIPDGIGAFYDSIFVPGKNFNLVAHHEVGVTSGATRSHGSKGAFVSRWTIERATLKVLSGRDQINSPNDLFLWNGSTYVPGTTAFDRFCSADMASVGAFFSNPLGTPQRIFLGGEETSPPFSNVYGRAWAHIATGPNAGKTYELPRLGKLAFENVVASPFAQQKTIVMMGDDASTVTNVTLDTVCRTAGQTLCATPSELYMYVGTKQSSGNEIERAGLTNGTFYGLRVKVNANVVSGENPSFVFSSAAPMVTSARFEFVNFGNVSGKTGQQLQDEAITSQVTQFIRVEDGAWDPRPGKERDYYFITTGAISTSATAWRPSRLWRLRFDNIASPEAGGTIDMLLTNQFYPGAAATPDADPSYQMFDNMTVDGLGRIVLQEDVGNNPRLGRIYVYGIDSGILEQVAVHNPKFFSGTAATNPNFLTNDEESSGVIDASSFLGAGWFLMSVQNHRATTDPVLVEGGQLLAVFIDPSIAR